MNFPVWDVGFGLPLLIALVAIPHVFIAHFAIGGGLFMVIYESRARKLGDQAMLGYVRYHSRFFMLLTLVLGAMSGVGIWFTIGLIQPAATSALIHAFVWFWATEWVMFFVEISAAMVYYYGWDRLDPGTHQKVMWVYFIAAWGSLAVINGIITFMLSSGFWPQDHNIWGAFFNPTYLPSLLVRTLLAFLLAGLFAFLTAAWLKETELQRRVNKIATLWTLPTLALLTLGLWWYYQTFPATVKASVGGNWFALREAMYLGRIAIGLLVVSILGRNIFLKTGFTKSGAVGLLIFGLLLFGSFEWYREAARKPFVISGYMYANGMLAADTTALKLTGYAPTMKWSHNDPARRGEDVFRAACASCHSLTGYNGLASKIAGQGWTSDQVANLIPRLAYFRGAMPPWVGTPDEAKSLADYLSKQAAAIKLPMVQKTDKQVWASQCGLCHTVNGFRPVKDAFTGMKVTDIVEAIKSIGDLSEAMPPFTGSDTEAKHIAFYISQRLPLTVKGGK